QALELFDFSHRISVWDRADLEDAFRLIEVAQREGCWVALLLDYELGEWLEPDVAWTATRPITNVSSAVGSEQPRLTALVCKQMKNVAVWEPPAAENAASLHAQPQIAKSRYQENIESIRASIARGDLYQTNYTFPIKVETSAQPLDLYKTIA